MSSLAPELRDALAIGSSAMTACCVLPYLRDVRRGTTRPHRVSWFVFATLSTVAAVAQFAEEGGAGAWLACGSAVGFSAVFVASIRRGVGGWTSAERAPLAVALAGIVASVTVGRPTIALLAVVAAELVAVLLTARKAVRDPGSETLSTWALDALAGGVALVAIERLSFEAALYPVHHLGANACVVVAILRGRSRQLVSAAPGVHRTAPSLRSTR